MIIKYFPLLAFIATYYAYDMKMAALAFAVASIMVLLLIRFKEQRWDKMEVFNSALGSILVLFVFGLNRPDLFMLKPSIIGALVAIVFGTSELFKFNIMGRLLKDNKTFMIKRQKGLDLLVAGYGMVLMLMNEVARRGLSEEQWVWFKVAAMPILTIIFMLVFIRKFATFNQ